MRVVQMMRKMEMLLHHFGLGCMGAIVIHPTRATGVFPRPPGGGLARARARRCARAGAWARRWARRHACVRGRARFTHACAFHPWPTIAPAFGLI